jgi:DNA-binding PadR family transcriptional regulator
VSPRDWRGWAPPPERLFDKGDFKYVALYLLEEKPRHGYEIIRALAERFDGAYTPSPGVVYPTLQMLEDMGYVDATRQDGRKVYALTTSGRQFLAEQRDVVDHVCARLSGWKHADEGDEQHRIRHELWELGHLLGRRGHWRSVEPEKIPRLREAIARARRELEGILAE